MRKGPAAEAKRDASQHAVGGIARRVFFFSSYLFISSSLFFFTFVSRPVDSTRPDQHFFLSGNASGGASSPNFVLKNAPDTLQTPRGRYFGIVLWNAPGGVSSVLYRMGMSRLTRDGTAEPVSRRLNPSRETKLSGTYRDREIFIIPVQLTTSRIGNLTRLIHTLLYVMTILHTYMHTYIHTYIQVSLIPP